MDEQNRIFAIIGKLYYDLVSVNEGIDKVRKQINILTQDNKKLIAGNNELIERLKYYEEDREEDQKEDGNSNVKPEEE